MELVMRNIHMVETGWEGAIQITPEEDFNLPETMPDIASVCLGRAMIAIEETRIHEDTVIVRGRLDLAVLYYSGEKGAGLQCFEGKIPFEEKIRLGGYAQQGNSLQNTENLKIAGKVENVTVNLINSRKICVRTLVFLSVGSMGIHDESVCIGLREAGNDGSQGDGIEYRCEELACTGIKYRKKDILRVKRELSLPKQMPNMEKLLWKSARLEELSWRLGDEILHLKGAVKVCVLYEAAGGETDGNCMQCFEETMEFTEGVPCSGCDESMVPAIEYREGEWELSVRGDEDGELRMLALEFPIELCATVYGECREQIINDSYGISSEVTAEKRRITVPVLLQSLTGKTKISQEVSLPEDADTSGLLYGEGLLGPGSAKAVEGGIRVRGNLEVTVLYGHRDGEAYGSLSCKLPYEYLLDIPNMDALQKLPRIDTHFERLSVTPIGGGEIRISAVISVSCTVFRETETDTLSGILVEPRDREKQSGIPGMAIYCVPRGESLWDIGKKYKVSCRALMELNELSSREIRPGQKLLIVKGR